MLRQWIEIIGNNCKYLFYITAIILQYKKMEICEVKNMRKMKFMVHN